MRAVTTSRLAIGLLASGALVLATLGAGCGKAEKGKAEKGSNRIIDKTMDPLSGVEMAPDDPRARRRARGPDRVAPRGTADPPPRREAAPPAASAAAPSLDPVKLAQEKVLTANRQPIRSLVFSPDGKRLVSVSEDNFLRLWDTVEMRQRATRKDHGGAVTSLAYSADGKYIASGDANGEVRTWLGDTAWKVQAIENEGAFVAAVGFDAAGRVVAVMASGALSLYKPYTGKRVGQRRLTLPEGTIGLAAVAPGGALVAGVLVSKDKDQEVAVWDAASGELKHRLAGFPKEPVSALAFSPDGSHLAIGWNHGAVRVHPLAAPGPAANLGPLGGQRIGGLALSPDNRLVGWGLRNRTAQLCALGPGKVLRTLEGHPGKEIGALAFSPDGKRVATGGQNGVILLWK